MPQMSKVAEAFLDGFGSLGAIFEPAVRPGSRENLIEEHSDSPSDLPGLRASLDSFAASGEYVFRFLFLKLWIVSLTIRRSSKGMTEVGDKAHHGA